VSELNQVISCSFLSTVNYSTSLIVMFKQALYGNEDHQLKTVRLNVVHISDSVMIKGQHTAQYATLLTDYALRRFVVSKAMTKTA
jgi:hypothetical protein